METPAENTDEGGERIRREAEFHDHRFAEGQRPAGRFYAITGASANRYEALVDAITPPAHVLELGCGLHSKMWDLLERGVQVTAIDISAVAIEAAEEEYRRRGLSGGRFMVMNAEALELPDDTFDAITGSGIIHHLDLARGVSECARVLKPGGRLILIEPMGHNPAVNLYRRRTPDQRTEDEHPLLMADFEAMRGYFEHVRVDFYHFLSLASLAVSGTKVFPSAIEKMDRLDRWVFAKVPSARRMAWMSVIEATGPR
jgi:ubiquinone/menaquinone biosynthesis C-methylase UbiE